jgi:gamma-glutamyl phosphate reductase
MSIKEMASLAKKASIQLAATPVAVKNQALSEIARLLSERQAEIIQANTIDLAEVKTSNWRCPS